MRCPRPGLAAAVLVSIAPALAAARGAQTAAGVDAGRVHDLLVLVASPDADGGVAAAIELRQMGPAVAPSLVAALKGNDLCRVQWLVSSVLHQLAAEPALVERTWAEVARGRCKALSSRDLGFQQDAAAALVERPSGALLVTALLRERDPVARLRAARALDALMARLDPADARAIRATPETLAAAEGSLRPLRDAANASAPQEVRCAAIHALDRASRLPHAALRARAADIVKDVRGDCRRSPAAGPAHAAAVPAHRENWQAVIARLDGLDPREAVQVSAALRDASEDVVPLLRARLQRTESCQGLALAAGALAARAVHAADTDAAFDRVAAGQCRGRDDFVLALAQGAASALAATPAGIARLTTLLGDRDVAVRRRAARALAGLYGTLGMGEGARPTSDPAIVGAARAALGPLLTLATTERDGTARCEAVRAIQRAQEARDDGLRGDADGQSRGRTLRCLAPPNP